MNEFDLQKINCESITQHINSSGEEYSVFKYSPFSGDSKSLRDESIWYKHFLISNFIQDEEFKFIVSLPKGFPYSFPKIHLHCDLSEYNDLPHVSPDLTICTFDSIEAQPNPEVPFELISETIKRAVENIEAGILGTNKKDYDDEFLAYWELEPDKRILSIITPEDMAKEIWVVDRMELKKSYIKNFKFRTDTNLKKKWSILKLSSFRYIVADNLLNIISWLESLDIQIPRKAFNNVAKRGLFLPLTSLGNPPFPKSNTELVNRINEHSAQSIPALASFLSGSEKPSMVVFGINNNDTWMLGAWRHSEFVSICRKGVESSLSTEVNGFRKGKHPLGYEFSYSMPIEKFSVENFDKSRLYKRGGNGLNVEQNYSINVVGCGSVGSFLVEDLVKIGFNNFTLVDKQILSTENLARHYCSFEYLFQNKAQALKSALNKKYPYLKILTREENIQKVMVDDIDFLSQADLNIFVIADYSTELMFNEAYKAKRVNKPTLIVWVEPYLKAGQAILLIPERKGCFSCLFKDHNYKYSYLKGGKVVKREAGCQSSYIPYGAIDISAFTNFISRIVDKIHRREFDDNMLFRFIKKDDELNHIIELKAFEELEDFEYCCRED